MSKILLVDATNNFLRNYAVVPTLTTHGEPNGGVYGTLNSLGFFNRIIQPDRIILAWDGVGGSKKRRNIIKDYKQGRKPVRLNRNFEFELENQEQNKIYQRIRLGQYLNDLPITQITVDDIEADDIIAYLVQYYANDQKIIASNDKDFYQLLDDKTVIYNTRNKLFLNNKYIVDTFNIHPKNFAVARAIAGDRTDNIPGIKGVGLKNVIKYFPFLSGSEKVELDQLFAYAEKDSEKYKKFLENRDIIIDNLKVMQLGSISISYASTEKIREALSAPLVLNGTSFRVKLFEDGITSINENYLHAYRILEAKGKE
jgi:DNA polymerase-1